MVKVPKSLTTVTLFSKILATIILVLIIPMASFYAGMQYEKAATIAGLDLPTTVTYTEHLMSLEKKAVRDYLVKYVASTTPLSQQLEDYKVYLPENTSEKDNPLSFKVTISVKPVSKLANTFWLSGNGTMSDDGWITGKAMAVTAIKKNGIYLITSLTPVK